MAEIKETQLNAMTQFINTLSATMGLTVSENLGKAVALEALQTEPARIQDMLSEPPSGLYATFSMNIADTGECIILMPDDCVQRLLSAVSGDVSEIDLSSLSEMELQQLNDIALSLVRGLAIAIGNTTGDIVELENTSVAMGELILPPIYAMEEHALRVTASLSIPDYIDSLIYLLFTPQFANTLVPAEEEGGSDFLDEDSIANMLSELEGMGKASPAPGHALSSASNLPLGNADANIPRGVDLILDISLDVTVELGRVRMLIKDVLELASGSIIELDRVAGEPVDVLVNGRLIAKGEVVVIEDNFGIRITEIISPSERAAGLGRSR